MDTTTAFACVENCWFTLFNASMTSTPGRRWSTSPLTYTEAFPAHLSAADAGKHAYETRTSASDGTRDSLSATGGSDETESCSSGCPDDFGKVCDTSATSAFFLLN